MIKYDIDTDKLMVRQIFDPLLRICPFLILLPGLVRRCSNLLTPLPNASAGLHLSIMRLFFSAIKHIISIIDEGSKFTLPQLMTNSCMQDTFARARDDRVSCIQYINTI